MKNPFAAIPLIVLLMFSSNGLFSQVSSDTTTQKTIQLEEATYLGKPTFRFYDTQTVTREALTKGDEYSFLNLLSGRVSGLVISERKTGFGSSVSTFIRGLHQLNYDQPLYVIDGIPIVKSILRTNMSDFDDGNILNDINIHNIESVEVLKSAAAAAIWGNAGRNGVILINTRRTKGKFQVEFNTGLSVEHIVRLPKLQNEYGGEIGSMGIFESWGKKFDGQSYQQIDSPQWGAINGQSVLVRSGDTRAISDARFRGLRTDFTPTPRVANPNNIRDFFNMGMSNCNNVSVSTSGKNYNARIAYGYLTAKGVIPHSNSDRNSIAYSIVYQPTKIILLSSNLNFSDARVNTPSDGIWRSLISLSRNVNINSLKEYWQQGYENKEPIGVWYSTRNTYLPYINPYYLADFCKAKSNRKSVNGYAMADVTPIQNWHVVYRYAISNLEYDNKQHAVLGSNSYQDKNDHKFQFHSFFTTYTLPLNNFRFDILAGADITKGDERYEYFNIDEIFQSQQSRFRDINEKSSARYLRLEASYNNTFFMEYQSRREFQKNDCFSFLPEKPWIKNNSVSGGVNLLHFIGKNLPLTSANLRVSYGDIGFYQKENELTTKPRSIQDTHTSSFEVGADLQLYNKHNLSVSIYNNWHDALFYGRNVIPNGWSEIVPMILGFKEHGFNLGYSGQLFANNKHVFEGFADLDIMANKITSTGLSQDLQHDYFTNIVWKEGESFPSAAIIKSYNGKPVYSIGAPTEYQKVLPDFRYSFGLNYSRGKLSASALFIGQKGGKVASSTYVYGLQTGNWAPTGNRDELITIDGYLYNESSKSYIPVKELVEKNEYYANSDYLKSYFTVNNKLLDASYLKLKELSVSYLLTPKDRKWLVKDLSIALIGRNLWTIAKQRYFDPERAPWGVEYFNFPSTTSYSLQLSMRF